MYSNERLVILDVDGTTVDAFAAIGTTFARHDMDLGDLERFQKRRNLFKYLGGAKEFPKNLKKQIGKKTRAQLLDTLTEVYREEATLYPGIGGMIRALTDVPDIRLGLVTRNITRHPKKTVGRLFERHDIDVAAMDFLVHIPLREHKTEHFRALRNEFKVNPARCYACGDEGKDFVAAIATGMHPFIVSYGFESHRQLVHKAGVPDDVIVSDALGLRQRVLHALGLDDPSR